MLGAFGAETAWLDNILVGRPTRGICLRQSVIFTMFLKKLDFSSNRLGWKMIQLLATENSMTRICNNEITHIFWINLKISANNYGSPMVDLLNNGFNTNIKKLQRERQPRRSSVLIVERNNVLS